MANIAQYSTVQQCITLQVQSKCKSISFGNILYQIQTFFPSQNNNTTTKNKSWLQGLKTTKKQKTNKHYKQQQQCTVLTARNLLISSWHEVVKIEKRKGRGKKKSYWRKILPMLIPLTQLTWDTHLDHFVRDTRLIACFGPQIHGVFRPLLKAHVDLVTIRLEDRATHH